MKKILFLATLAITFFTSCSNYDVDVAIDNPTQEDIIVKIDTLAVEVPARQVVWVEMGKGQRTITLPDGEEMTENFSESVYMLNPTRAEYLLTEEYYGPPAMEESYPNVLPNKEISIMGMPLEGNFDKIDAVVNKVRWDYGPRESTPNMIETDGTYEVMLKLYDMQELMESLGTGE